MMMLRGKRDIKPLLLKVGLALALSLAGFIYSRLRNRRIKSSSPPPSPRSSDYRSEVNLGGGRARGKDDQHAINTPSSSCNIVSAAAEKYEETFTPKVKVDSLVSLSPSSKNSGDKDGFLLPEFNDLVKEFDFASPSAGFSPMKGVETPMSKLETPKAFVSAEKDEYEQEIGHLKSMVINLRERERNLEFQLLEYYGLKEQETAVMELQNRLKINNMEAKLFTLKIQSLQADNKRLEAQVADHAKVVAELEDARAKIKLFKKKLRSEAEQNRQQILGLQQRVAKLKDQELKTSADDPDMQLMLQKLKDLGVEAEELRKSNLRLKIENSELGRRLESTQILANSVLEDPEAEVLREEREHLRLENEDLAKEIDQLQANRCSDVGELVYVKWINACLRYELRNYQTPDGKTLARDLSKTLSPKSEEKAKRLILEYANNEGMGEKGINIMDFDSDQWSSSHTSFLTDSGEFDDSSADNTSATKTNTSSKSKLYRKLRRLILGKDIHHDSLVLSAEKTGFAEDGVSPRSSSIISAGISAGTEGQSVRFTTPPSSSRLSLDFQRLRSPKEEDIKDIYSVKRNSDVGSSSGDKGIGLSRQGSNDLALKSQLDRDSDTPEKSKLLKYAQVLKDSRAETPKFRRRGVSFSSF